MPVAQQRFGASHAPFGQRVDVAVALGMPVERFGKRKPALAPDDVRKEPQKRGLAKICARGR